MDARLNSVFDSLEQVLARINKLENGDKNKSPGGESHNGNKGTKRPHSSVEETEEEDESTSTLSAAVQKRLAELGLSQDDMAADDDETNPPAPKKLGRCPPQTGQQRTAATQVKVVLDWPHYYVFKNTKPATFNDLAIPDFVYGFLCLLENAQTAQRPNMTTLLKDMMEDLGNGYQWPQVKGFYAMVMALMEAGRLEWHQNNKIQQLRSQHVWAKPTQAANNRPRRSPRTSTASVPCPQFQSGTCQEKDSHSNMSHSCAYCKKQINRDFPHAENNCRRKQQDEKNGQ